MSVNVDILAVTSGKETRNHFRKRHSVYSPQSRHSHWTVAGPLIQCESIIDGDLVPLRRVRFQPDFGEMQRSRSDVIPSHSPSKQLLAEMPFWVTLE